MLWIWGDDSASKVLAPHEFNLQHPHKPLVVAVCICSPSQGEVEIGCCRDQLASCLVELVSSRSLIGKKRRRRKKKRRRGRGGREGERQGWGWREVRKERSFYFHSHVGQFSWNINALSPLSHNPSKLCCIKVPILKELSGSLLTAGLVPGLSQVVFTLYLW